MSTPPKEGPSVNIQSSENPLQGPAKNVEDDPKKSPKAPLPKDPKKSPNTNLRKRKKTHDEHVVGKSIGKVVVDEALYGKIVSFVKKNRPRSLTAEERLDILLLQAHMRYEHEQEKKKHAPGGQRIRAPQISKKVAKSLRRDEQLVKSIWSDFIRTESIDTNVLVAGNRTAKSRVIPDCRYVTSALQEFVRERRVTRTRTVAKDVLDFFVSKGFMTVNPTSKSSMMAALRVVQRFLVRKGYKCGGKKGSQHYQLREKNSIMRDKYVTRMVEEDIKKTRRMVYIGESYVHKNYCRHEDSIYDPNDEQDLMVVATTSTQKAQQQRYCFITAIVDADHTIPEESRTTEQKVGLLIETLDIFEDGKKQSKGFQGMFDHNYFVTWMEKLLAALKSRNITNAIIVMDHSKYHRKFQDNTPRKNSKRSRLQEACTEYGIPFEWSDTKVILWEKLHKYMDKNVVPIVVKMAQNAGHELIYSPPHYWDLQPIESIWGIVKGDVGRQYTPDTTYENVLMRLKAAFHNLNSQTIDDCIQKANSHLRKLHDHIQQIENMDEPDDGDSSDSHEDNPSSEDSDSDNDTCTVKI